MSDLVKDLRNGLMEDLNQILRVHYILKKELDKESDSGKSPWELDMNTQRMETDLEAGTETLLGREPQKILSLNSRYHSAEVINRHRNDVEKVMERLGSKKVPLKKFPFFAKYRDKGWSFRRVLFHRETNLSYGLYSLSKDGKKLLRTFPIGSL